MHHKITDALLWRLTPKENVGSNNCDAEYLIDVPTDTAQTLQDHLIAHKLPRTKVIIRDRSDELSLHCVYGTLNAEGPPPGYIAVRKKPEHFELRTTIGIKYIYFRRSILDIHP
jgi:hypothetical protein